MPSPFGVEPGYGDFHEHTRPHDQVEISTGLEKDVLSGGDQGHWKDRTGHIRKLGTEAGWHEPPDESPESSDPSSHWERRFHYDLDQIWPGRNRCSWSHILANLDRREDHSIFDLLYHDSPARNWLRHFHRFSLSRYDIAATIHCKGPGANCIARCLVWGKRKALKNGHRSRCRCFSKPAKLYRSLR